MLPHRWLHPLLVIHQHLSRVDGVDRDVTHHSKVTTIVQMLILNTEKVPYESAEYLQYSQDTAQDIPLQNLRTCLPNRDVERPEGTKNEVLQDRQSIVQLRRGGGEGGREGRRRGRGGRGEEGEGEEGEGRGNSVLTIQDQQFSV